MWEYEVKFKEDRYNSFFIWGYSFKEACKRNRLNPAELTVLSQQYID